MKKFNMLALIALSLAAIGNVGAFDVDAALDASRAEVAAIKAELDAKTLALQAASRDAIDANTRAENAAVDRDIAQKAQKEAAAAAAIASTKADDAAKAELDAKTELTIVKAAKVPPAVAKKSAPFGTRSQGTAMIQQTKAITKGLTGKTNTVSSNQLKAIKTLAKPTTNAVAQTIANSKMPITATGSISAKTSANAKSKIDGSAFTQGAQIQSETNSNVSGSTNTQGAARAASSNNTIVNYSGANLSSINKALGGAPAKGAAQKGIISQGISGAMNMLDSDTKNKGGLNITGGKGEAAKSIQHGVGGLGNITNRTNMMTTGAQNFTGDAIGSQNSMTFSGSDFNSNI